MGRKPKQPRETKGLHTTAGVELLTVEALKVLISLSGMSQRELAAASGMSESQVSEYLSGAEAIGPTAVVKFSIGLKVSPDILARAEGISLEQLKAQVLAELAAKAQVVAPVAPKTPDLRLLPDPEDIDALIATIPGAMRVVPIDVYSYIAAGGLDDNETVMEDAGMLVSEDLAKKGTIIGFRISGDSMAPTIVHGQRVAVLVDREACDNAKDGQIVLARVGHESTLKRLRISNGERWLSADSKEHKDIRIKPGMNVEILGVAVATETLAKDLPAPPAKKIK